MHKNLGNTIFMLLFISFDLCAWVKTTAHESIMKTEVLEFTVIAKGFSVKFPKIEYIDGYVVQNIKTSHEATLINAKKADKVTKVYSLTPDKDVVLPVFSIKVDGKIEKTKALLVKVKKRTQTQSSDYKLSMDINKKTPMVGEKMILHVRLVYKDLLDYTVFTPHFNDFSLKELSDKEYENDKGEWVEELAYEIIPKKVGTFILHPAKAAIELSVPKHKKRNIYSNALRLSVKAIPNNLSIIGDYELHASVNKTNVNKNKPVKLTLTLLGSGNINNFDDIKIEVPGATVYEKSTKHTNEKSFDIISDKNFTIPSVSLQYYDVKEQKAKEISTYAFAISVEDSKSEKTTKKENTLTMVEKIIYFIFGMLVTLFLVYMYKTLRNIKTTDKEKIIKKELQSIQSKEELLKKVVPYLGRDKRLDHLIYALENIENTNFKKLKKEIITYFYK